MKWLALFLILLLAAPALAGTATITIFGTNASNAQANLTNTGNQSINVTAWNVGGVKTFRVNVTNTSDTLTFQLSNITVNQVNELKINGTAINGYQADSNGNITFIRVQTTGNSTFNIAPAVNTGGSNFTWGYFQNLVVQTLTTLYNVSIYNATTVQGNGSGLSNLTLNNITGLQAQQDAQNASSDANNTASQGRDDSINSTKLNKTDLNATVNPYSFNAANATNVLPNASAPASAVNRSTDFGAWTNYSSTSTIVGWSSFTKKELYYQKIGTTVHIYFAIYGVSDSSSVSFTLPYSTLAHSSIGFVSLSYDNGVLSTTPGRGNVPFNSNIATVYTNFGTAAWTASGDKEILGEFFYETN